MTRYLVLAIDDDDPGYVGSVMAAIEDLVEAGPDGMLVATEVDLSRPAGPIDEVTQAEWEAHQAFYRLTVAQRDRAWAEVEAIKA